MQSDKELDDDKSSRSESSTAVIQNALFSIHTKSGPPRHGISLNETMPHAQLFRALAEGKETVVVSRSGLEYSVLELPKDHKEAAATNTETAIAPKTA